MAKQAFRRDRLSANYRTQRAHQVEHAASVAEHRRHRARLVARETAAHDPVFVVEDCGIRTWYRLWAKRLSQTPPGILISALDIDCKAAGGRLVRACTWSTALSQHCLCGERVCKTLWDREHKCIACGLVGRRDLVSAALAAFVRFTGADDPKTAYLDTTASRNAQITYTEALEERCGSQPHRARNRPVGRIAWQSHCNAVTPLLPEPPDSGTEQPRMSHDLVATPERPIPAPRSLPSSPLGELRIKS